MISNPTSLSPNSKKALYLGLSIIALFMISILIKLFLEISEAKEHELTNKIKDNTLKQFLIMKNIKKICFVTPIDPEKWIRENFPGYDIKTGLTFGGPDTDFQKVIVGLDRGVKTASVFTYNKFEIKFNVKHQCYSNPIFKNNIKNNKFSVFVSER